LISTKQREFNIKKNFFEQAGGNLDSIFPLFMSQPAEPGKFAELDKAKVD